jgi:hypothetical protein
MIEGYDVHSEEAREAHKLCTNVEYTIWDVQKLLKEDN